MRKEADRNFGLVGAFGEDLTPRVQLEADLILQDRTIAEAAKKTKVGTTTVWRDLHRRLPLLNLEKYRAVEHVLNIHAQESIKRATEERWNKK